MISDRQAVETFVWTWLPGTVEPVVAGRLVRQGASLVFNYGRSYLERPDASAIYLPELPLRRGSIAPLTGLSIAGCLRDAAPDAWGRRVILNRMFGGGDRETDPGDIDDQTYLMESGSDRTGALDFQASPSAYVTRSGGIASLGELLDAAALVEAGMPLSPALDAALIHASSIGGARPKASIVDADRSFIAKFSSSSDIRDVIRGEFVAMRLAARAGLNVATVELRHVAGKDVLLVERFDRVRTERGWARKAMVSALTILELDEMMARYASYQDLAETVRHRFIRPSADLCELFGRMVFNVLVGNTDDHARNHAAFWGGSGLAFTPAYDICPQSRSGGEASQAMLIAGEDRSSRIRTCLAVASQFLLSPHAAEAIVKNQICAIIGHWNDVCDEAGLKTVDRNQLWRRQILNAFAFDGAPHEIAALLPA